MKTDKITDPYCIIHQHFSHTWNGKKGTCRYEDDRIDVIIAILLIVFQPGVI